jgi:hypothetical protein
MNDFKVLKDRSVFIRQKMNINTSLLEIFNI